MKTIKIIHNINKWSFILSLVLYLTVLGGLLAQIALGFIQVILALIILSYWKTYNKHTKNLILIYWALVISYGLGYLAFYSLFQETNFSDYAIFIFIFSVMIIPMSIAGYFVYITYKIKKHHNEFKLDCL